MPSEGFHRQPPGLIEYLFYFAFHRILHSELHESSPWSPQDPGHCLGSTCFDAFDTQPELRTLTRKSGTAVDSLPDTSLCSVLPHLSIRGSIADFIMKSTMYLGGFLANLISSRTYCSSPRHQSPRLPGCPAPCRCCTIRYLCSRRLGARTITVRVEPCTYRVYLLPPQLNDLRRLVSESLLGPCHAYS
ncbi:hypothetical protein LZ32DRAFT_189494 [Colletotrichum eremochloae]|nr:hypothetical protein LZ32DRAFT_189494 [Colletotrichum eremochloae]